MENTVTKMSLKTRKELLEKEGRDVMLNKAITDLINAKALLVLNETYDDNSSVLDAAAESLGYDYNNLPPKEVLRERIENMTFGEFIQNYAKILSKIQYDEEYGRDKIERIGLPLFAIFQSLNKNYSCKELNTFFDMEYYKVIKHMIDNNYSVNKLLRDLYNKRDPNNHLSVRFVFTEAYGKCREGWIPVVDIREYIRDIKIAISQLDILGFELLYDLSKLQ